MSKVAKRSGVQKFGTPVSPEQLQGSQLNLNVDDA